MLFEAKFHDKIDYQEKCIKILFIDLKEMLVGLKSKIFHKSFKKSTNWDENHIKFVQSVLVIFFKKKLPTFYYLKCYFKF